MIHFNQIHQQGNMYPSIHRGERREGAKQAPSYTPSTQSDMVLFTTKKSEKFQEVFAEFDKNVPDSTSTIEEKELAIEYIDRMLACEDIPQDMKIYWQNKKDIIQQEIQRIKNEQNTVINNPFGEQKTSEKFQEVFAEMRKNVPDSTSTIEEKELAIEYIDRMLACEDIPNAEYWQNKKNVINMEIQTIKNEQKIDNISQKEQVNDVWNEFRTFIRKYFTDFDANKLELQDRVEYNLTYYNTYISFCNRLLACIDVTPEQKTEYLSMIADAHSDIKSWQDLY